MGRGGFNQQKMLQHHQHASIDVEDVSGGEDEEELSITSVKGEGCGSDLSDSEATTTTAAIKQQQHNHLNHHLGHRGGGGGGAGRSAAKKAFLYGQAEPSLKRPNTPLDFRGGTHPSHGAAGKMAAGNRPIESAIKSVRFQPPSNEINPTGKIY